jgi:tetratricopeptide (TPR) repeat protein
LKNYSYLLLFLSASFAKTLHAQKENATIRKGNRYYKEQKFDESQKQYQQALQQSPDNAAADYNLGNAQYRKNSFEEAAKSFDDASAHADNKDIKEKSFYNKGVASVKQKKLEESIVAWKDALKLNPADDEARDNLQKALMEQKDKQQQQKDNKKQEDKKQDNTKQEDKKQDQKKQEQPQQQQSRLSKQKVEQYLKALEQKEKDVQDKMNQNKMKTLSQPEKDW